MRELTAEIAIIGGGTGGVAAALAGLRAGRTVIMTEETDWVGGQLTSQAVPPDEHPWIESFGCTASYRKFRDGVREYYRQHYPLTPAARHNRVLNPGSGWVSKLCHEPRVGLAVLEAMLQPYLCNGQLTLLLDSVPVSAQVDADRVLAVTVKHLPSGGETVLLAPFFLDATELGDLLPLTGTEFVMGAEAQSEHDEPHAPVVAQPFNQQSASWCFALSHYPEQNNVIERPRDYDFWRNYKANFWPARNLSWTQTHPENLKTWTRSLFSGPEDNFWQGLWLYRQILDPAHFESSFNASAITLVNWPQIDYWLGPIAGVSPEEKARHLEGSRQLALSFLYWMQTEAPRHDDKGQGYPGLRLRGDACGTVDGLAKSVYVRESRRIKAEYTVVEQHLASAVRSDGAQKYSDSVGVGSYRIDLHPSTGASGTGDDGDTYIDVGSWPFQIPLGSLIPQRMENLLPACKNLGTTHITNGCYRLHPVEWNIGEAAGALAAHCLSNGATPRAVRNTAGLLRDFQRKLEADGFELDWPCLTAR